MAQRFLSALLGMSFAGGYAVIFLLIARLALKRAPKLITHFLWLIVLFRLLCPWSFESAVSLLDLGAGAAELVSGTAGGEIFSALSPGGAAQIPPSIPATAESPGGFPIHGLLFFIWALGAGAVLLYNALALRRFWKGLGDIPAGRGGVKISRGVSAPFVAGLFRPAVYLPAGLPENESAYILLHERTHIKRLDHALRLLWLAALCLHWFNPLAWAAFFLSAGDMEMACDEAVIKKLGPEAKRGYSSLLLSVSAGKKPPAALPLAFNAGDAGRRIKNVLNYRRPRFWIAAAALAGAAVLAAGLAANPAERFSAPRDGAGIALEYKSPSGPVFGWLSDPGELSEAISLMGRAKKSGGGSAPAPDEGRFRISFMGSAAEDRTFYFYGENGGYFLLEPGTGQYSLASGRGRELWGLLSSRLDYRGALPGEAALEQAASDALLARFRGISDSGDFAAEAHVTLMIQSGEEEGTYVLYAVSLRMGFEEQNGGYLSSAASFGPVALTLREENGGYAAAEIWEPENGHGYSGSIRGRFPFGIQSKALEAQQYYGELEAACLEKAARAGIVPKTP